ncbi:unnamed protein product [Oikopleura dioica]|nr:unnamed protein product [Oikopleura dioica]
MSYYKDFPDMFQNLNAAGKTSCARQVFMPKNLFEISKMSFCRLSRLLSNQPLCFFFENLKS